jgi:hypothetical protein
MLTDLTLDKVEFEENTVPAVNVVEFIEVEKTFEDVIAVADKFVVVISVEEIPTVRRLVDVIVIARIN